MPAVEESGTSGEEVARINRSMSEATNPASSSARLQASTAKSEVCVFLSAIRRFFMPVFVVIHSSFVSTISAQSALLISCGGTYAPSPMMPTEAIFSRPSRAHLSFRLNPSVVFEADVERF